MIASEGCAYRLAFGPNAGRKALTLKTVPATERPPKPNELVSRQAGFSLHAGVACTSNQRKKLERICRYITRPAIAEQRLSLASNGNVTIGLKTPYDDGTTHDSCRTESTGIHREAGSTAAKTTGQPHEISRRFLS